MNYIFRVYISECFANLSHKTRNLPFIHRFGLCTYFIEQFASVTTVEYDIELLWGEFCLNLLFHNQDHVFSIAISALELANVVIVKLLQNRYFTLGIFALLHANALHLLDGELFAIFFSAVDDAK